MSTETKPIYRPGDIVRIVAADPTHPNGFMIRSYLGQEAKVLDKHPELDLYVIEIDIPRRPAGFGGSLDAPRFNVGVDMIEPDVTPKMIEIGEKLLDDEIGADTWWACDGETNRAARAELATKIYSAMRAARFER